jgi:hypothetical protein
VSLFCLSYTGNLDYTRYRVKKNKTNNTGNLDYTRYRVKKNKTNNTGSLDYTRYRVKTNKTKTLATLITQDTGRRQTKQITHQGCQCLCFVCLHPVSCVIKVASVICFVFLHTVSCVIKVASVFVLFVFTLYLV